MRSAIYHPQVPREVRDIVGHYEKISQKLADDFWEELLCAVDYASKFPERHHFDISGRRRSNLTQFPYHFLFRVFPDCVRITVVKHNHRNPRLGTRRA
jgi:plasmid stabilization system protein ParE